MRNKTRKCSAKYIRSYTTDLKTRKKIIGYVFPDKPNMIYQWTTYNKMQDKPIKIRSEWQLDPKSSKNFIEEYYCGKRKYAISKPIPEHLKSYKVWRTLNNGGIAFIVYVDEKAKNVEIYGWPPKAIVPEDFDFDFLDANTTTDTYFSTKIGEFNNCEEIFIGKSPLTKMTKKSGGYGSKWDGNTILLDLGNKKYVAIFQHITRFTAKAKIVEYVSEVGNSAVPYPYAKDADGNIYLIIEDRIIPAKEYSKITNKSQYGPYMDYYDNKVITEPLKNLKYIFKNPN